MDEPFVIPVVYKNKDYHFDAQLFTSTYTYRIQVVVDDIEINFERDDENNFRAISASADSKQMQQVDTGMLQAIATAIEKILS